MLLGVEKKKTKTGYPETRKITDFLEVCMNTRLNQEAKEELLEELVLDDIRSRTLQNVQLGKKTTTRRFIFNSNIYFQ